MRRASLILILVTASFQVNCGGTNAGSSNPNPPPGNVVVSILPATVNVRAGDSQPFTPTVTGTTNISVTWQVNGVTGGTSSTGTIDASGVYVAPSALPNPNTVTVKAISAADSTATDSSAVTLWNPAPVISSVGPMNFPTGAFSLTVNGSKFVSGAQILFAGAPLTTIFGSSTQLTATGSAPTAGMFAVSVKNPNPGSSTSSAINVQVGSGGNQAGTCSGMTAGQGGSLNGFMPFPSDNLWNKNIANAPVDPNSSALINFIGPSVAVHPDFGAGLYAGSSIGIPYTVVDASQSFVGINFTAYGDESDPGPMPIPATAPIEGYPNPGSGDRHVLVLDNNNCWLYELYSASTATGGAWNAASAAVWDLQADGRRPQTWTSADAAGLPIFPGLARYDEVAGGQIHHALRFTLQFSRPGYIAPASHWASNSSNANAAPMGMRLRLKSSFNISSYSTANQVILTALKQYGMIMADNGSSMYISGAPDDRWDNNDLHQLGNITASDFEVVQMGTVTTQSNLPSGSAPTITSFTATPQSVNAGSPVTLDWNVAGASYFIVSPQVGAVRGTSVTVNPAATVTYTLSATNQFGRSTAVVNVTVH